MSKQSTLHNYLREEYHTDPNVKTRNNTPPTPTPLPAVKEHAFPKATKRDRRREGEGRSRGRKREDERIGDQPSKTLQDPRT